MECVIHELCEYHKCVLYMLCCSVCNVYIMCVCMCMCVCVCVLEWHVCLYAYVHVTIATGLHNGSVSKYVC